MQTNGDGVYNAWHFSANIEIVVEIYRIAAMGPTIKIVLIFQLGGHASYFRVYFAVCGIDINGNRLTDLTNMDMVVGIMFLCDV